MFQPINELLENFTKLLNYQETFINICREHPVLAILLVFLLLIFSLYLFYQQSSHFLQDFQSYYKVKRNRKFIVAFLFIIFVTSTLIVASISIIVAPRPTNIRVPGYFTISPPGQPTELSVLGTKLQLEWDYQEDNKIDKYAVCYSQFLDFSNRECVRYFTEENNYIFQNDVNGSYYWQVAALDDQECDPQNIKSCNVVGQWSEPKKISQYSDIDCRIAATGQVLVGISKSVNQGNYLLNVGNKKNTLEYNGLDYKIAEKIVNKIQDSVNSFCKNGQNPEIRYDLSQAKNSSLKLQPVAKSWSELLDLPKKGQVDMIISTISYRPDRKQKHNLIFSVPYAQVNISLVFSKNKNAPDSQKLTDILSQGIKVGVQENSTAKELLDTFTTELKDVNPKFKIVEYANPRQLIDGLKKSEVDFLLMDTPFAKDALEIYKGSFDRRELLPEDYPQELQNQNSNCDQDYKSCMTSEHYVIGVRESEKSSKFFQIVNATIKELKESHEIDNMEQESLDLYKVVYQQIEREKQKKGLY